MEHSTLIRSKRRTLALQIKWDGTLIIRAPLRMPQFLIEQYIESKKHWIEKHQIRLKDRATQRPQKNYSEWEILELKDQLKKYIIPRVRSLWETAHLPPYTGIKITRSERRWWSCSGKNALCFSYRLWEFLSTNPSVIDAIIFHEIAHLKEKNHGKKFWKIVYELCPNYDHIIKNIHY